jgi:tryptophan synthase beta chain
VRAGARRIGRAAGLPPERDLRGGRAAHAIRAVVEEAEAAREAGESRVLLLGLSGHGHFDLSAYDAYLAGELEDPEFSEHDMEEALARLPEAPAIA